MTVATRITTRTSWEHHVLKFFRTPKGIVLIMLVGFTLLALTQQVTSDAVPAVVLATAVAAGLDVAAVWLRHKRWEFPSGALLTGLIVALLLRPQEPLSVVVATAAIAIVTKHVLRSHWSNIFNPAALAIVISAYFFSSGDSWWGALPDLGLIGFAILLGCGLFIADRINKLPLVIVFLATYFGLFTLSSFVGKPVDVAEVFRAPDLQAALFFAFFMLDDPPTCPIHYEDQIPFAVMVAVASFLIFTIWGAVYFLPAGLLVGNAWESARRYVHDASRKPRIARALPAA
jgi:Na+-translocating ferredoxin:NAD+ oxidoreductase RnfD subunit